MLLDLGEDEVELLVLLPVLVGVEGAGVDQVVQELGVASGWELTALALTVHPLGFKAEKSNESENEAAIALTFSWKRIIIVEAIVQGS